MFTHQFDDEVDLASAEPTAVLQRHRVQPHLGSVAIPLNMDVRRFEAVTSEKEEPVGSDSKDGWHASK